MLRLAAAILLARPATIAVDVGALALPQAQTEQLHGELMTRLLESGHAVGSHAAVVVRLTGGGEVVHVEVVHGRQLHAREVTGRGALLRLSVIHATIDLLAELEALRGEPDPVLTASTDHAVVVELLPGAEPHATAVVAAIVESGWVVTPAGEDASRRVCVGDDGGHATLAVVDADGACDDGVPEPLSNGSLAARLAARGAAADPSSPPAITTPVAGTPAPTPIGPPAPAAVTPARPSRPSSPAPRWSGAIGLGLGVEGRLRAAEPVVLLHGDARHAPTGVWLTLRAEVAPASGARLAIADTMLTTGVGWGRALARRLRFELAVAAGVLVHGYRVVGDRGIRVDPTAVLPLTLALSLGTRVELALSAFGGISGRARSHVRGDTELWSRDRVRIGGMLGVRVRLDRKPRPPSRAVRS